MVELGHRVHDGKNLRSGEPLDNLHSVPHDQEVGPLREVSHHVVERLGFLERFRREQDRPQPHEIGTALERDPRAQARLGEEHNGAASPLRTLTFTKAVGQLEHLADVVGCPVREADEMSHRTRLACGLSGGLRPHGF